MFLFKASRPPYKHQTTQAVNSSGLLVGKWGGKKENKTLTILQTSLHLNTFVQYINLEKLRKYSHRFPIPLSRMIHVSSSAWNITMPRGNFLLISLHSCSSQQHLIISDLHQILTKSVNSFCLMIIRLILNFPPSQN